MLKKCKRHFCLLVLGAFKAFLAVCLVMREDVEHQDRAVKNKGGERPSQDREHKQVEHSRGPTRNCPAPRGATHASTKEERRVLEGADVGRKKKKGLRIAQAAD